VGDGGLRVLGIDPDLHALGWAVVEDGKLVDAGEVKTPRDFKGAGAVVDMAAGVAVQFHPRSGSYDLGVVEGQQLYTSKLQAGRSLIYLAQVAGAAMGILTGRCGDVSMPTPQEWKGNMQKTTKHKQILRKLKVDFKSRAKSVEPLWEYPRTSHVIDAAGLALWGYEQLDYKRKKEKYIK